MAKALRAFQSQRRSPVRQMSRQFDPKSDWASATVSFPVLVTTAQLFCIDVDKTPVEAVPVRWVPVSRDIAINSFNGVLTMMVVSVAHLSEYLQSEVLAFADGATRILEANPTALTVTEQFDLKDPAPPPDSK
jgi:hypothetical protein